MGNHMCAVKNGKLKCWGLNMNGDLGLGDSKSRGDDLNEMGGKLPYIDVGSGLTVKYATLGCFHICAHLSSNGIKCWGLNDDGQLGQGDTINRGDNANEMGDNLAPISLGSGLTASAVVKCFGNNIYGQLGQGDTNNRGDNSGEMGNSLAYVDFGSNVLVKSIHTGVSANHNCVILSSTLKMKCWGLNNYYQLGYGDTNNRGDNSGEMGNNLLELDLGNTDTVDQIAIGEYFTCILKPDANLKCWGRNNYGQLGQGSTATVTSAGVNVGVTTYDYSNAIVLMAAGGSHFCIVYSDYTTVKCIGLNDNGQLGQGDTTNRGTTPVTLFPSIPAINLGTGTLKISSLALVVATTCVVFVDSSVKCFGSGNDGILGTGNINSIGDGPGDMGSNLPYVDIFSTSTPTKSPTKSPTTKKPTTPKPTTKSPTI